MRHAHIYELADASLLKAFEKPIIEGLLQSEKRTQSDDITFTKEGDIYYRNKQKYEKATFPASAQDIGIIQSEIASLMRHINTAIIAESKATAAPLSESFRGMFPLPYFQKNPTLVPVYADTPDTLRHYRLTLEIELPAIVSEKAAEPEPVKEVVSSVSKTAAGSEPSEVYQHFLEDWKRSPETETTKAPLRNHAITFYLMVEAKKIVVVGMDYLHKPIMREKPLAELLEIYNPDGVQPGVEYREGYLYWVGGEASTKWEKPEEKEEEKLVNFAYHAFLDNRIILHSMFELSYLFNEIIIKRVLSSHSSWKEFITELMKSDYDLLILPTPSIYFDETSKKPVDYVIFKEDGYYGLRRTDKHIAYGFTTEFTSYADLNSQYISAHNTNDVTNYSFNYKFKYLELKQVEKTFNQNRKLIVVNILYELCAPLQCYYDIAPRKSVFDYKDSYKDLAKRKRLFVDYCHCLIHEIKAHALNRLKKIHLSSEKEHLAYQNKEAESSPETKSILSEEKYKSTQAYKDIIELQQIIERLFEQKTITEQIKP